ncbi:MAG: VOC family protein [Peptostreptococcaceae bacterium]
MKFTFCHNNFNVLNLEKSLEFYEKALGLVETKRTNAEDGSFTLVFLGDGVNSHKLELTWLRDWDRPYNLGDNEFHLAFRVEDFDGAYKLHKEMGCICYENKEMGIYFIADPDNYWIEILPANR